MDKKDFRIIGSLISGFDNRQISSELDIPLSILYRGGQGLFSKVVCCNIAINQITGD